MSLRAVKPGTIQKIKNYIGKAFGYGECPSCDSSWMFTDLYYYIDYEPFRGMRICKRCFDAIEDVDNEKICKELISWGWDEENVKKVFLAIENMKKTKKELI
jgi:hypothetical protein